ncbi:hypothetical protein E1B28_010166 [Marasmius oreades]|uniref:Uncharacterized protein n=1 Tax=Marasmius oreades TaxID=181124 RepID=A0A9P7UQV3_9AGAR|nr:uncharacterized protein E1B28_010166 [Marasmius oreades]KAG7091112.1 hypothetical protein E1B28_010166 [Marasmius oreades]
MSSTVTLTYTRPRRLSLSLLAAHTPPPLLDLPAELILDVLELSLKDNKASTLAVVCKTICSFVDAILYRKVVLNSKDTISLFHRTTLSKPPSFFATHVNKLILTYNASPDSIQFRRVLDITSTCSGLRSLVLPSGYKKGAIESIIHSTRGDNLAEILIHSHEGLRSLYNDIDIPDAPLRDLSYTLPVTHLRISEPGDGFVSPCSFLSAIGPLPRLSHLQLSRRINSNEDNDQVFVHDVDYILRSQPELQMLVVSVFPLTWAPMSVSDIPQSSIWFMMEDLSKRDARLVVRQGEPKEWKIEWNGVRRANLGEIRDFWAASKYKDSNTI